MGKIRPIPSASGLRAARGLGENRRAVAEADDRDPGLLAHAGDEALQGPPDVVDLGGQRLARVDEDDQIDRIGGTARAQHLPDPAVLPDDEVVGRQGQDGRVRTRRGH